MVIGATGVALQYDLFTRTTVVGNDIWSPQASGWLRYDWMTILHLVISGDAPLVKGYLA